MTHHDSFHGVLVGEERDSHDWPITKGSITPKKAQRTRIFVNVPIVLKSTVNSVKITLILLMDEILHQLRLVVYPIIYRVLYIPGGAGFLNHQQYFKENSEVVPPKKIFQFLNNRPLKRVQKSHAAKQQRLRGFRLTKTKISPSCHGYSDQRSNLRLHGWWVGFSTGSYPFLVANFNFSTFEKTEPYATFTLGFILPNFSGFPKRF